MKNKEEFKMQGTIIQGALMGSALVALLSIGALLMAPSTHDSSADMRIEPAYGGVTVGKTFVVQVYVTADIPVNVFRGEVLFDPKVLSVDSIDYNTSIADLWAELPWYQNGDGTVNFTGGTTQKGGFMGNGSLITITFKAHSQGETSLRLVDARILEHNGLGTEVPLSAPIDALFAVEEEVLSKETIAKPQITTSILEVMPERPSTDLNSDGKQTLADISIFTINIFGSNPRYDFNLDGLVDTKDLSIIMSAK